MLLTARQYTEVRDSSLLKKTTAAEETAQIIRLLLFIIFNRLPGYWLLSSCNWP